MPRALAFCFETSTSSLPWPTSMVIGTIPESATLYTRRKSSMQRLESRPPE